MQMFELRTNSSLVPGAGSRASRRDAGQSVTVSVLSVLSVFVVSVLSVLAVLSVLSVLAVVSVLSAVSVFSSAGAGLSASSNVPSGASDPGLNL